MKRTLANRIVSRRPGKRTKRKSIGLVSSLVVMGAVFIVLMNLGAATTAPTQSHLGSSFIGVRSVCVIKSAIGSPQQLWTPTILLNSPYGGSATGSSSTTTQTTYSISYSAAGSYSVSTASTTSSSIGPVSNGEAVVLFQLDTWQWYQTGYVTQPGSGSINCNVNELPEMTATSGSYWSDAVLPSGTTSDANEPTNAGTHAGDASVSFNNGYSTETGALYICATPTTFSTQQTTQTSVSISPTINFGGYSATLSINMQSSSSTAFSYTFSSIGTWYYSTLDGSANNGAWAFYHDSPAC